jgi:hypothetical protein
MIDHTLLSISMLRLVNNNLVDMARVGQGREPEQP